MTQMPSFQITISPSKRAAGRFVYRVRRALQKALAEEQEKRGLNQSAVARAIGVHRSVINRELRGRKDITLGRVAELAWALGRRAVLELPEERQAAEWGNHRSFSFQTQLPAHVSQKAASFTLRKTPRLAA